MSSNGGSRHTGFQTSQSERRVRPKAIHLANTGRGHGIHQDHHGLRFQRRGRAAVKETQLPAQDHSQLLRSLQKIGQTQGKAKALQEPSPSSSAITRQTRETEDTNGIKNSQRDLLQERPAKFIRLTQGVQSTPPIHAKFDARVSTHQTGNSKGSFQASEPTVSQRGYPSIPLESGTKVLPPSFKNPDVREPRLPFRLQSSVQFGAKRVAAPRKITLSRAGGRRGTVRTNGTTSNVVQQRDLPSYDALVRLHSSPNGESRGLASVDSRIRWVSDTPQLKPTVLDNRQGTETPSGPASVAKKLQLPETPNSTPTVVSGEPTAKPRAVGLADQTATPTSESTPTPGTEPGTVAVEQLASTSTENDEENQGERRTIEASASSQIPIGNEPAPQPTVSRGPHDSTTGETSRTVHENPPTFFGSFDRGLKLFRSWIELSEPQSEAAKLNFLQQGGACTVAHAPGNDRSSIGTNSATQTSKPEKQPELPDSLHRQQGDDGSDQQGVNQAVNVGAAQITSDAVPSTGDSNSSDLLGQSQDGCNDGRLRLKKAITRPDVGCTQGNNVVDHSGHGPEPQQQAVDRHHSMSQHSGVPELCEPVPGPTSHVHGRAEQTVASRAPLLLPAREPDPSDSQQGDTGTEIDSASIPITGQGASLLADTNATNDNNETTASPTEAVVPTGGLSSARRATGGIDRAPELASSYFHYIEQGLEKRGVENPHVSTTNALQGYDRAGKYRLAGPWARVATHYNARREKYFDPQASSRINWDALLIDLCTIHINDNLPNQVITSVDAAHTVLSMASSMNIKFENKTLTQLIKRAKKMVQAKATKVTEAIDYIKVNAFIIKGIESVRTSTNFQRAATACPLEYMSQFPRQFESVLRAWSMFGQRMLTAGRPQDCAGLFHETEMFLPHGTNFLSCTSVSFKIFDTKDVKSDKMNKETTRPKADQQDGLFSSSVHMHRPTSHESVPDFFRIFHFYRQITSNRRFSIAKVSASLNGRSTQFTPVYVGVDYCGEKRNHPITTATASKQQLTLLRDSGAIDPESSTKAEHIRHSSLSIVYHWYANNPSRLPIMRAMLARSRHSMGVFLSNYHVLLNESSAELVESYAVEPKDLVIEDLLVHVPFRQAK